MAHGASASHCQSETAIRRAYFVRGPQLEAYAATIDSSLFSASLAVVVVLGFFSSCYTPAHLLQLSPSLLHAEPPRFNSVPTAASLFVQTLSVMSIQTEIEIDSSPEQVRKIVRRRTYAQHRSCIS